MLAVFEYDTKPITCDLTLTFNMPGTTKKVIADIQVTCLLPTQSELDISVTEALKSGKISKYYIK